MRVEIIVKLCGNTSKFIIAELSVSSDLHQLIILMKIRAYGYCIHHANVQETY